RSLELLKEVAPAVTRVGFIFNPDMSAYYDQFLPAFETQAQARCGAGRRPDGATGCLYLGPPRPGRAVDGAAPYPCDLFLPTSHQGGWPDVIRARNVGNLPALGFVC